MSDETPQIPSADNRRTEARAQAWSEYLATFDREAARKSGTFEPRRRAFEAGFEAAWVDS